ncbi:amidohydrolase family protein [Paenibacillus allorhizosphaerae]|uniref:Amidohydrolase-related domain-containing protein n=1 Tax=Paenibacillus allorhizosphaerae TaxID=2849866 RepID=A0ABN7TPE2_9BACL|nr:amidohydrolase family protein [Paenibacillus allorhizosphaerae]CAG7644987.1 hypothetical protein PAECIP111802_03402 [Paenibacillus allorhizosphaerae]
MGFRPDLFHKYKHLGLIDVHNHDADYYAEKGSIAIWERYHIDKTVLFGSISEPAAMVSDKRSWKAYTKYPEKFYPFFSGFSMYDEGALAVVKEKLEKGYYGVGETVAASTYSPLTSKLQWKAQHPMDGNLPAIYELCAQYKVPILLHIDPPFGEPIDRLKEALRAFPDTKFIFAHANVYNPPERMENLLSRHTNLYIDFFAGFTVYDPNNQYALESYIPLIRNYSERFFLSTDSATARNLNYEKAINAMYEVIDLCEDEAIGEQIARRNFLEIIEAQPATRTQIDLIERNALEYDMKAMNKRMANELIIANKLDER